MNFTENEVVLVDEKDRALATMDKLEAHELGLLHRAFSVFIFNNEGKMLIHKRALTKYHSGGLWTNACCSHPYPGEGALTAGKRRLHEELGFTCDLYKAFDFIYRAEVDNSLTEHEFDHVFVGNYSGMIKADPEEVAETKYVELDWLVKEIEINPNNFTTWFKIALPRLLRYMESEKAA